MKELPENLASVDPITIYRASLTGDISGAKKELSWTTDLDTALFFYGRYIKCGKKDVHLYRGTIEKSKIIAYTNQRKEFEVLQHMSVRNIEEVAVSMAEVADVMDKRAQEVEKQWDELIFIASQVEGDNEEAGD